MKALLLAPMGSVHRRFNSVNIQVLRELGYEVHLLANFERGEGTEAQNPDYAANCTAQGIITHSLPFQRHEIRKNISLVQPTRELMLDEDFDLVHAHTETGGLILRMAGYTGARRIYSPHGMSFYQGAPIKAQLIYRPIEKWICSGMHMNIAINQGELDVLKAWNPSTATLVHGVGLDLTRFQGRQTERVRIRKEFGIPKDATVVLSVGELDDNKNHTVVLEALKDTDAYYLICGEGPNREKLIAQTSVNGMGNRLVLAGYRSDIPDVIGACDIFAFPSYHEGMPVSMLEAIAGGLPVVCSNIRGNVDVIRDAVNGYLVSPEDVDGWTKALETLINDCVLRQNFQDNAIITIADYACDHVKKELTSLYQKVSKR